MIRARQVAFAVLVISALATTSPIATAAQPPSAAVPAPRTDKNSMIAHEQLVAKARQGKIADVDERFLLPPLEGGD